MSVTQRELLANATASSRHNGKRQLLLPAQKAVAEGASTALLKIFSLMNN